MNNNKAYGSILLRVDSNIFNLFYTPNIDLDKA